MKQKLNIQESERHKEFPQNMTRTSINNHLIEQTEHPKRDAMGCANLNIVDSQIAVCYVLYLLKGLVSVSNFNGDGVINKEIACAGKGQGMSCFQLIDKERFPNGAYLGIGSHGIEQVGILHIELWGQSYEE